MSAVDSVPTPSSVPNELNYSEPIHSIPPGYRIVNFRQVNYNTIPSPTPGGTEIQINIPQIPNSFIDPSTTFLNIRCRITGTLPETLYTVTTESSPANLRPGFVALKKRWRNYLNATGWGLFSRYQVYANNSVLIEDIDEIGYLAHMLNSATKSSSTMTTADLNGDSCRSVLPGHRFDLCSTAFVANSAIQTAFNASSSKPGLLNTTINVNDGILVAEQAAGNIVEQNTAPNRYANAVTRNFQTLELGFPKVANNFNVDCYRSVGFLEPNLSEHEICTDSQLRAPWSAFRIAKIQAAGASSNVAVSVPAANRTWQHDFDLALPLIGILGANNDKLFPCIYPTQIRLITEQITNILNISNELINPQLTISNCEFVCNYLRLDSGAMSTVLSSLPMPGIIPMRCTSFVHSSTLLPQNTSGAAQVLVSTRRASMKALFIGFASQLNGQAIPAGGLSSAELAVGAGHYTEGPKFNSINPNLGQNTYLTVNGVFYPQQMLNPMNKPADCLQQFLTTLNMTQSSTLRPNIEYANYIRCDFASKQNTLYNLPALYSKTPITSTSVVRAPAVALADANGESNYFGSLVNDLVDVSTLQWVGRNQFYLAIDTEHFGKRGFLSGVSTLGGSVFMNFNIEQPLTTDYIVRMYNFHDVMLAFNMQTGQVEVKI